MKMKRYLILINLFFLFNYCYSQVIQERIYEENFENDNFKKYFYRDDKISRITDGVLYPEYVTFKYKVLYEMLVTTKIIVNDNKDFLRFQARTIGDYDTEFSYMFCFVQNDFVCYDYSNLKRDLIFSANKNNVIVLNKNQPIEFKLQYFDGIFSIYANEIKIVERKISQDKFGFFELNYSGSGYSNFVDYIYVNKIVPNSDQLEQRIYNDAISSKKYDNYLSKYPDGKFFNEVIVLKEELLFTNANNGFLNECEEYLSNFPNGKYVSKVSEIKTERSLYKNALNGGLKEFDAYLLKYTNGNYTSEINSLKTKKLYEIDRQKKIKANSNKVLWKIGNKLCYEHNSGTICGTLVGWNEDKSMLQFKVISGPNIRIEGEQIKPDAIIWLTPTNEWHICIPDEIETSLAQNEDPYKYWKLGKKICLSGTKGAWLFKTDVTIIGEIVQWNEDRSKVRIRIIDGADGTVYNNETLYNDKLIWDSPTGWKICN